VRFFGLGIGFGFGGLRFDAAAAVTHVFCCKASMSVTSECRSPPQPRGTDDTAAAKADVSGSDVSRASSIRGEMVS
jgi:hypothetical protein